MTYNYIIKNSLNGLDILNQVIFKMLIQQEYTTKNKFSYIDKTLSNCFYNDKIRGEILNDFCKIQRTYNAFTKLACIYKYKKSKIVIDTDLCLNVINEKDKNIICILENNKKYLFNIQDLINIINTSLINSQFFFSYPLNAKNPYTNVPFNKSTLYNIYFFIKFNTLFNTDLICKYYNTNFNLAVFSKKYEYLLREHTIENFTDTTPDDLIYDEIQDMIYIANHSWLRHAIDIHEDFPKKNLVKIMRPYFKLWMYGLHSCIPSIRELFMSRCRRKLREFVKFNPQFGRRIIKINYVYRRMKRVPVLSTIFDERHPVFVTEHANFLQSHLSK